MELRQAKAADLSGILELVNKIFCRVHGKPETMREQFPLLFSEENVEHLWVAVEGNRVVSHVGIYTAQGMIAGVPVQISSIGSVATDWEYRNKGLSTQLLQKAFNKLREEGTDLILVSGDRGLYFHNGCYRVGKMARFVLNDQGNLKKDHGTFILQRVDENGVLKTEVAEKLIEIESQESTRFIRSVKDLQTLYEAAGYCRIFPWKQEAYWVKCEDKVVAYFIAGIDTRKAEQAIAHVIEFHGDRQALSQGLVAFKKARRVSEIVLPLLNHEQQLKEQLMESGFERKQTMNFPGTVKLLNLIKWWEKFRELLVESPDTLKLIQKSSGKYCIQNGSQPEWEGTEEQFAQWIFTRLPLPWPNGLNYI